MEITTLKYYDVNREGWLGITSSLVETNRRLEWCDVREGEYLVIDSDGWVYKAREDDESRWGYRWKRTDRQDIDAKMVLVQYVHGEHLTEDELNFIR